MPEEHPATSPEEALERGLAHFNAGRYFQAHEAWEEGWHPSPEPERDFWQGLTQVAVGLTHRQRGNAHGAETLLQRGAAKLRTYGDRYMGIPVQDVAHLAEKIAERVARDGTTAPIEVPHIERNT